MTASRFGPCVAVSSLLLCMACSSSGGGATSYPTPKADAKLGAEYDLGTGSATFRVWAPAAKNVSVLLFAAWNSTSPAATHAMSKDLTGGGEVDKDGWNGVWQATASGVPEGQLYQYALDGAAALDPYARSMGRFDSSTQRVGMGAVVDPTSIPPVDLVSGSPVTRVPFTAPPGYARRDEAIVYEVHVRDYTIKVGPATLANPPGTYQAFAERLDHIRALGVTHVQLLPVLAYYYGDEGKRAAFEGSLTSSGNNYNWGYDPHNFFSPDGMYSADPADPVRRVQELKTLVNEAHRAGLGVTLDVVYNHTATTAILDVFAPGYFYRGSNSSGTGNDTASEKKMMRKLIVDSVRYLTQEYGVDGFRFDLMGLIDSVTMRQAYQAASGVNPHVLFIGEGWRMGGVPAKDDLGDPIVPANQDWMTQTDDIAVFSDSFRDIIKGGGLSETSDANVGFITSTGTAIDKEALLRNLRGDATNFAADSPGDAVQYLTAHDGLTLHDKISKILRLNPDTQAAEIHRVARLGFALQATSQGIAFLHGGCEMGRSKRVPSAQGETTTGNSPGIHYVYNSYDASDAVNGFDWEVLLAPGSDGGKLRDYVQGLLALRKSTDAFRLGTRALATANGTMLDGTKPYAIAYKVADSAATRSYSVFVNAGSAAVELGTGDDLRNATVVVDDDEAGPSAVSVPSGFSNLTATAVTLAPRTAVVFRRP